MENNPESSGSNSRFSVWEKLSFLRSRNVAIVVTLFLIVMLPLVTYIVQQQTRTQQKAYVATDGHRDDCYPLVFYPSGTDENTDVSRYYGKTLQEQQPITVKASEPFEIGFSLLTIQNVPHTDNLSDDPKRSRNLRAGERAVINFGDESKVDIMERSTQVTGRFDHYTSANGQDTVWVSDRGQNGDATRNLFRAQVTYTQPGDYLIAFTLAGNKDSTNSNDAFTTTTEQGNVNPVNPPNPHCQNGNAGGWVVRKIKVVPATTSPNTITCDPKLFMPGNTQAHYNTLTVRPGQAFDLHFDLEPAGTLLPADKRAVINFGPEPPNGISGGIWIDKPREAGGGRDFIWVSPRGDTSRGNFIFTGLRFDDPTQNAYEFSYSVQNDVGNDQTAYQKYWAATTNNPICHTTNQALQLNQGIVRTRLTINSGFVSPTDTPPTSTPAAPTPTPDPCPNGGKISTNPNRCEYACYIDPLTNTKTNWYCTKGSLGPNARCFKTPDGSEEGCPITQPTPAFGNYTCNANGTPGHCAPQGQEPFASQCSGTWDYHGTNCAPTERCHTGCTGDTPAPVVVSCSSTGGVPCPNYSGQDPNRCLYQCQGSTQTYATRGFGTSAVYYPNCNSSSSPTTQQAVCLAGPTPTTPVGPSVTPTPTPTGPTATLTPPTGNVRLNFTILVQGVGLWTGLFWEELYANSNPISQFQTRPLTVEISDSQNVVVMTKTINIIYNPTTKYYTGTADLGVLPPSAGNQYTIRIKTDAYVKRLVGLRSNLSVIRILTSGTYTIPLEILVGGDVNNDDVLNILDYYNGFGPCFKKGIASNCKNADFDADGQVNLNDHKIIFDNIKNGAN